jgi:hypothetical protein
MPPLPCVEGHPPVTCVVGDRFGASCGGALVAGAFSGLSDSGWNVAHNRPYAGGYVLDRHADPRGNIHAIQLEIDRAAYLDSRLVERGEGFAGVVDVLTRVVRDLACDVAAMGARGWPPAPAVGPKPPNKPFPEAIKKPPRIVRHEVAKVQGGGARRAPILPCHEGSTTERSNHMPSRRSWQGAMAVNSSRRSRGYLVCFAPSGCIKAPDCGRFQPIDSKQKNPARRGAERGFCESLARSERRAGARSDQIAGMAGTGWGILPCAT